MFSFALNILNLFDSVFFDLFGFEPIMSNDVNIGRFEFVDWSVFVLADSKVLKSVLIWFDANDKNTCSNVVWLIEYVSI